MQHPNDSSTQAQIVYLSHGGGPLPLLGDSSHKAMLRFMRQLPTQLRRPDAVVVISAHWEENTATLLSAEKPQMFYDYYNFPEKAYSIQYPAPGNPQLAQHIAGLIEGCGILSSMDGQRGFDHGLFIPLKMMYPMADIPSIQLSLIKNLSPISHLALGKALRPLLSENILLVGSGFSFHNMRAFEWDGSKAPDLANDAFQNWLIDVCTAQITEEERDENLLHWTQAPFARYCHPREEHLLPLCVCAGMAGKSAELIFDDYILGKRAVSFKW